MKKLNLLLLLLGVSASSFADNNIESDLSNASFQKFDNQYYMGLGYGYGNLQNGYNQNAGYGVVNLGLGVERLFDMGLWMRFDALMMSNYYNYSNNPNTSSVITAGMDPSFASMNMKLGYAFTTFQDTLQLTPYALAGRNTNLSANAINNNTDPDGGTNNFTTNATQDYFLTGGIGGRVEWRLDDTTMLYADQNILYNADMSHPNSNYSSASNTAFNTQLGAKFNVWRELQIGAQAQYSHYILSNNPTQIQMFQMNPTDMITGMITIGLTY